MDRILSGGLLWCSPSFPASLQVAVRHSWFLCVTTHNADFGKNASFDFDFIHFPPRSKIQFRGLEHPGLHGRCESLKLIMELWWATAVHFASWNMLFFPCIGQQANRQSPNRTHYSGDSCARVWLPESATQFRFFCGVNLIWGAVKALPCFTNESSTVLSSSQFAFDALSSPPFIFLSYIVCISFFVSAFSNTLFCICIFQTQLAILTEIGMARRSMLSVPTCDVCVGISTNSYPLLLGVLHGTPWRV